MKLQYEVINSYEDMKDDLHEIKIGLNINQKKIAEISDLEKYRTRAKEQEKRDREIVDEMRLWSLKRKEERNLMKKIKKLENENLADNQKNIDNGRRSHSPNYKLSEASDPRKDPKYHHIER